MWVWLICPWFVSFVVAGFVGFMVVAVDVWFADCLGVVGVHVVSWVDGFGVFVVCLLFASLWFLCLLLFCLWFAVGFLWVGGLCFAGV